MDGVFRPKATAPSDFSSHPLLAGLQSAPKNPVLFANAISSIPSQYDIPFTSLHAPPYEEEQLALISFAYPLLKLSYLFCEDSAQVFGFFSLKNGTVRKPSVHELESFKRTPHFKWMMEQSTKMNKEVDKFMVMATVELSVTWVVNRISATGTGAAAFARDFMASVNRTKLDARKASMDGVFATDTTQPPQVSAHISKLNIAPALCMAQLPYGIVDSPDVIENSDNSVSVMFGSHFQPVYEKSHLTAISNAYPHANFTFDYAGRSDGLYGRWYMSNGDANKVSSNDLVAVMRQPEFVDIINRS